MDGIGITDLIWNSANFVLDLKTDIKTDLLSDQTEFSEKTPRPSKALVDIKQYKQLIQLKEKIPNCLHWEKWSKLVNPYDKVHNIAKNKNTKDYYKYFEILKYFNISRDTLDTESSAHFGESALSSAKALSYILPKINWYASIGKEQGQEKEKEKEKEKDNNGYSRLIVDQSQILIENLKNFSDTVGKVKIFIGDSSTDTAHDPINQEQLVLYSLFTQIVTALQMQLDGGHLIIKIFDSITRPTCQLIQYITNFYEHVSIIKPRTSRYTNSEKFIVARKFRGIEISEIEKLNQMIIDWNPEHYLRIMGIDISEEIETRFLNFNRKLIENQCNYIEKTIKCNYNEDEIPEKQLEAFQNKNAMIFCSNFGIPINLSDSDISVCKHVKKKKVHLEPLHNAMVCEKCFSIIIGKA